MSEIICPQCKGSGKYAYIDNWFGAVVTMGITALVEKSLPEKCRTCKGKGKVELKQ